VRSPAIDLDNDDLENIIKFSSDDVNVLEFPGWDNQLGYGRINAHQALRRLNPSLYDLEQKTAFGGSDQGADPQQQITILDVLGLADGLYWTRRHEVRKTITFTAGQEVYLWGRGVATTGWVNKDDYLFGNGFCEVVPGSQTATSAVLRTYLYEVKVGGQWQWYPTSPGNVTFAYTILRKPSPPQEPPPAPQNLVITNAGSIGQSPNLSWDASSGADSYNVYRCAGYYSPCNWQVIGTTTNTSYTDFEVIIQDQSSAEDKFYYYVTAVNSAGESDGSNIVSTWGDTFQKRTGRGDAVSREATVPEAFAIYPNYPNPFNPTTEIRYELPQNSYVSLTVYNLAGQKIRTLVDDQQTAGYYRIFWDGKDDLGGEVASGVYVYRILVRPQQVGDGPIEVVRKMTLLR
jgi:hypothetical protein